MYAERGSSVQPRFVRPCRYCRRSTAPILKYSNRVMRRAAACYRCATAIGTPRELVRRKAMALVKSAIRRGELAPLAGLRCIDCGAPATIYEHRDYSRPLDVVPACQSCNVLRGPAVGAPPRAIDLLAA